jgi:signal transduction histidine kinase/CheY-like chemotaxis protein
MTARHMGTERRDSRLLAVLVVALLGGTVMATALAAHAVRSDQEHRFDSQTDRLDAALAERMTAYEQVLHGGLGLFLASEEVTQADWVRYVETLRIPERYPGFKSLSYAPAVPTDELDAYVAEVRADRVPGVGPPPGSPPYTVRAPSGASGETDLHGPIRYVAPDGPQNWPVLGVDMMLEPTRREVMLRAAREGRAVASPRLHLSGSSNDEAGFIVYVPIERDGELEGWLTAAFLAEAFAAGLDLARATHLDLEIRDGAGADAGLLHSSAGVDEAGAPRPLPAVGDAWRSARSTVAVPGGTWEVTYVARDDFVPTWVSLLPWGVLLLGMALTVGLVAAVRAGERWRRVAVVLDEQAVVLREARETAEAATLATSSFLATMSHEIRTPLNAVLGANSLLLTTDLDDVQAGHARVIRDSGGHLLHVVNDVLDLSKAEAGRVVLEDEPFDLGQCMSTVADLVGAGARRGDVLVEVDLRAPRRVVGDVARLRQVLLNLVSNAVRFTPEGGRVLLSAFTVPAGEHLVGFEVADDGIGIAPDHLAELFDPYVQAGASTTRTHGGTGLGLSIARRLVEAMGGTITVDSTLGEGSTFRFTVRLPAVPEDAEPEPSAERDPSGAVGGHDALRVLVAEDDAVSQELLVAMLDLLGPAAEAVDDGAEALERVVGGVRAGTSYDVVFLDRHLPGLDGLEVARRVRALSPATWIVAISGSVGPDGGLGDLADDVVAKPFVLDDVAAALRRVPATVVPATPPGG